MVNNILVILSWYKERVLGVVLDVKDSSKGLFRIEESIHALQMEIAR